MLMLSSNTYTLTPSPTQPDPIKEGEERAGINWDEYLSIKLIREHTKTDNVPAVTDEQLKLYRAAAVEAAEFYTGMLLSKQKMISEIVETHMNTQSYGMLYSDMMRPFKEYITIRLQYPSSDGIIYIYGNGQNPEMTRVTPNTRKVKIHSRYHFLHPDLSNCCDPCSKHSQGLHIMYRAGFSCTDQIPAGVLLGMLQFVTWVVEHPGDEVLSMRNTLSARGGALIGTNNIAMISGALESWRQFDPEAF
jgi:hypothetical protein